MTKDWKKELNKQFYFDEDSERLSVNNGEGNSSEEASVEDLKKFIKQLLSDVLDEAIGEEAGNTQYSAFNDSGAVNGYNLKRKSVIELKNKLGL